MTGMQVRLFGSIDLIVGDDDLLSTLSSTKARSLLAYLFLYRGQAISRDRLAGLFWPDRPDESARRALSQTLWRVRSALGAAADGRLTAEHDAVTFELRAGDRLDVAAFEEKVYRCTGGQVDASLPEASATCLLELSEAVALYRADFLENIRDDWALLERERLRELYLGALERLVTLYKQRGDYDRAVGYAQRLAAADPLREAAHRELMRLYHLLGHSQAALDQFAVLRNLLVEELEISPTLATVELYHEIAAALEEVGVPRLSVAPPSPPLLRDLSHLPLVGRTGERAQLSYALQMAAQGCGGVALVEGDAGVGKTRLVDEVIADARWRGFQVAVGKVVPLAIATPYQLLREALSPLLTPSCIVQLAELVEPVWLSVVSAVLPMVAEYLPDLPALAPLEFREQQQRLWEGLGRCLMGLATSSPLLLVLEDMQWADEATLAVLLPLASRIPTAQVLVVLTARTAEARQQVTVWEALEKIDHVSPLLRLCLRPFDPSETAALVGRALGVSEGDAHTATLGGRLHDETGGNALFLVESLKSLLEQGSLAPTADGGWNLPAADEPLPAPASIQDLIAGRLARLAPSLRTALELVAVSGEDADFPVLSQAGVVEAAALPSTLEALRQRGFLVETGVGYRFEHDRIRETAYAAIERERRRQLHRQIGAALEALHPERVESLAYHYGCGELWDRAANYSHQAGDRARAVYANAEAAAHYTRAIEAAEQLPGPADPSLGFTLRLAREAIYDLLGERAAQVEDLEALQALAERLGVEQRADVALRQANYAEVTGDYPSAIVAARTAIDLAQAAGDVSKEAAGHLQWGRILWHEGKHEASRPRLEQALALSRAGPALHRLEAASLRNLCIVSQYQSDFDSARVYGEQARRIYHEIGDRQGESDTLKNLGTLDDYLADYASAEAHYEQALHICREIGYRRGECDMLNNLAIIYDGQGDYSRAKAYYEQALHISHEIDYRETWIIGNLGAAFSALGLYDAARACHEESLAICRKVGSRQGECVALANLSQVFHQLGDDKAAQDYGQQTLHLAQDLGDRYVESYALTYLGHALAGLEQWSEAAEMHRRAMAIRRELGALNVAAESLASLAHLSLTLGDLAQAQAQVEEILSYLEDGTLDGTDEPFQVYLTCYRVLCAGRDPRAEGVLVAAHRLLQERAARIEDEELRQSFLENVVAHREIIAAYCETQVCQITVRLAHVDVPASRSPRDDEWVEVTWTSFTPKDSQVEGKVARRRQRLLRLLREAREQSAVPTVEALALALDVAVRTIKRDLAALRAEGYDVYTRGTRA